MNSILHPSIKIIIDVYTSIIRLTKNINKHSYTSGLQIQINFGKKNNPFMNGYGILKIKKSNIFANI